VREWESKLAPLLSKALRKRCHGTVGASWYVDETYRYSAENSEAFFMRGGDRQFMSYS
jgi:transposase-like protein